MTQTVGPPGSREAGDKDPQAHQRYYGHGVRRARRLGEQQRGEPEHGQAGDHADEPREEQRFASDAVYKPYRHERQQDVDDADYEVGVDGRRVPVADVGEGRGGVIDDGVDADYLLEDGEPYGHYQGGPDPRGEQLAEAALFFAFDLFYLADLVLRLFLAAATPQHVPGIVIATPAHEPAWCLRHEVHADEQDERRDYGQP